jgi:hypothetical protein
MLRAQNGACAICKRKSAEKSAGKLCVDHCHARDHVRGLLCRKCNLGLGCFRDDPARIRSAIAYRKANGAAVRQVLGRAPQPQPAPAKPRRAVPLSPVPAHVPAKACPGLDPGWTPVRRQEHAPLNDSRACSDSVGTEHALGVQDAGQHRQAVPPAPREEPAKVPLIAHAVAPSPQDGSVLSHCPNPTDAGGGTAPLVPGHPPRGRPWTNLNRSESTHGFRTIQDRPKDIAAPQTHLRLA